MFHSHFRRWFAPVLLLALAAIPAAAEDPKPDSGEAERFEKLTKLLDNVALVGRFTVVGQDQADPKPERYEIRSVRKLEEEDLWLFNARIKYGDTDMALPLPLHVKWAGNTPVITLDNVTIPGMGTFSSYVVLDGDKYAGTWSHGEVGGHLFGRIEKLDAAKTE